MTDDPYQDAYKGFQDRVVSFPGEPPEELAETLAAETKLTESEARILAYASTNASYTELLSELDITSTTLVATIRRITKKLEESGGHIPDVE